jgi:hypothetical protein
MWWCVPRHRPTPLPVAKVNVLEQDVPTPDQPNPDDSRSWTEAVRDEPRSCGSALGNQRNQPDSSSTSPDRVRAGALRMTRSRGSDLKHPLDGRLFHMARLQWRRGTYMVAATPRAEPTPRSVISSSRGRRPTAATATCGGPRTVGRHGPARGPLPHPGRARRAARCIAGESTGVAGCRRPDAPRVP